MYYNVARFSRGRSASNSVYCYTFLSVCLSSVAFMHPAYKNRSTDLDAVWYV